MYKLTEQGIKKYEAFIVECNAKRKEILDAGKDAADDTLLPTVEDIEIDIEEFIDEGGDYYNHCGVTDNYESDYAICLTLWKDFKEI